MDKKTIYIELIKQFEFVSKEQIAILLCNYFDSNVLTEFVEFIEEE